MVIRTKIDSFVIASQNTLNCLTLTFFTPTPALTCRTGCTNAAEAMDGRERPSRGREALIQYSPKSSNYLLICCISRYTCVSYYSLARGGRAVLSAQRNLLFRGESQLRYLLHGLDEHPGADFPSRSVEVKFIIKEICLGVYITNAVSQNLHSNMGPYILFKASQHSFLIWTIVLHQWGEGDIYAHSLRGAVRRVRIQVFHQLDIHPVRKEAGYIQVGYLREVPLDILFTFEFRLRHADMALIIAEFIELRSPVRGKLFRFKQQSAHPALKGERNIADKRHVIFFRIVTNDPRE